MPKNAAQAEELVDQVVLQPTDWGPDFVPQAVAESRPRTVAVLDGECRWQREPLPASALASLSRYAELPGRGGKGTVRVTAVATVHTSEAVADEQLAATLEETRRCREQEIRPGERLTGLHSAGSAFGMRRQQWANDSVYETGTYVTREGAHPYLWSVARVGSVIVNASVKGARGYTEEELQNWFTNSIFEMVESVETRTGREG
ncbi:hypothetical protein LUX12_04715 [Streptomyces somaliensis]|uniref:hypothetical protein n=1 Tax=Streptomyces somaliensis TaxID=78355 RepID=UPI0020CF2DA0|nr:hypothetical protein [Streptomyces somaliensis]MCP9944247.1 hypothetical protein [Streptomyces somaliensis]MCP9962518.1 hypothetical protein [Streptomyces somaliensis]MCP9975344.1 hypothetical protein [Streptomyces somaliensis]